MDKTIRETMKDYLKTVQQHAVLTLLPLMRMH